MAKASLGSGNVEIELNGETVNLRPTLKAAQTISRQTGGIIGAIEAVSRFDFDVLASVVALGLDRPVKDVVDDVWRTGVSELAPRAIRFLGILANGGRPVDDRAGGEEDGNPQSE